MFFKECLIACGRGLRVVWLPRERAALGAFLSGEGAPWRIVAILERSIDRDPCDVVDLNRRQEIVLI